MIEKVEKIKKKRIPHKGFEPPTSKSKPSTLPPCSDASSLFEHV